MPSEPGTPGIRFVIPVWNGEDRLARTLESYLPALERRGDPFEVVVGGVRDRTAEVAARYASHHVRLLQIPNNLGKGDAIRAGPRVACHEYVGYLGADVPISPEAIYGLVGCLEDVDRVVASRWLRGAVGVEAKPLFNRVAGRAWNFLTRSLLFLPLRDIQAREKFFRGSVVRSLLRSVTLTYRPFDLDLLYHVRKWGGRVKELPVRWAHDPASHTPVGRALPVMFLSQLRVRLLNSPVGKRVPPRFIAWPHGY